ncbi:carbon dioxide concentrating mechanism protein [Chondrocystis sp. NIES-4102]|nr:carbon dioxide concentrating mechanism protein [Chondrocystis sp. NIES-4102]
MCYISVTKLLTTVPAPTIKIPFPMIYLPPPQPVLNKDIRISGDVEIHPTASLAPGVILQAAPDSRIVIGADVCIGMGVIINACGGLIEIDNGAILGAGVLIVGISKVGNNACIGTSTTIFQSNIAAMTVVEPGSIIGDVSRKNDDQQQDKQADLKSKNTTEYQQKNYSYNQSNSHQAEVSPPNQQQQKSVDNPAKEKVKKVETPVEPLMETEKIPVVGQFYINELLITLFPHKKNKNSEP